MPTPLASAWGRRGTYSTQKGLGKARASPRSSQHVAGKNPGQAHTSDAGAACLPRRACLLSQLVHKDAEDGPRALAGQATRPRGTPVGAGAALPALLHVVELGVQVDGVQELLGSPPLLLLLLLLLLRLRLCPRRQ